MAKDRNCRRLGSSETPLELNKCSKAALPAKWAGAVV